MRLAALPSDAMPSQATPILKLELEVEQYNANNKQTNKKKSEKC